MDWCASQSRAVNALLYVWTCTGETCFHKHSQTHRTGIGLSNLRLAGLACKNAPVCWHYTNPLDKRHERVMDGTEWEQTHLDARAAGEIKSAEIKSHSSTHVGLYPWKYMWQWNHSWVSKSTKIKVQKCRPTCSMSRLPISSTETVRGLQAADARHEFTRQHERLIFIHTSSLLLYTVYNAGAKPRPLRDDWPGEFEGTPT